MSFVDNNNSTALMLAAWYGHSRCLDHLIQEGASVNSENNYGQTALLLAAYNGREKSIEMLIAA